MPVLALPADPCSAANSALRHWYSFLPRALFSLICHIQSILKATNQYHIIALDHNDSSKVGTHTNQNDLTFKALCLSEDLGPLPVLKQKHWESHSYRNSNRYVGSKFVWENLCQIFPAAILYVFDLFLKWKYTYLSKMTIYKRLAMCLFKHRQLYATRDFWWLNIPTSKEFIIYYGI